MNETPRYDGLVSGLQRYRSKCRADGGDDPFTLPFSGKLGVVPHELAKKFSDLDAAFGATISISLSSEFSARIEPLAAAVSLCESPIEARFLLSLICACAMNDQALSIRNNAGLEVFGCTGAHGDSVINIRPQQEIGEHRVDFALELTFTDPLRAMARMCGIEEPEYLPERRSEKLVVECDGHDFHEKTADQAMRDKSRDRDLLNYGYPVMRFTGSELCSDPLKCSLQVVRDFFEINKDPEV